MNRVLLLLTVLALVVTTACAAPNPLAGTGGTSAPAPRAQAPAAPATGGAQTGGGGVVIPTNPNDPANAYGPPPNPHWDRIAQLDQVFRSQGWQAWLKAAGVTWEGNSMEARQIEEETSPQSRILASGAQVNGKNIVVNWPNIVTTDVTSRITKTASTVAYQPDNRNGSTLYTNVVANGPVTVWTSGFSWGQFTSRLGMPGGATPASGGQGGAAGVSAPASNCQTIGQLKALGTVLLYQDTDGKTVAENSGKVAGVQIRVKDTWQKPDGWEFHVSGNTGVTSISAGQTGTAWSPESCRPLI